MLNGCFLMCVDGWMRVLYMDIYFIYVYTQTCTHIHAYKHTLALNKSDLDQS